MKNVFLITFLALPFWGNAQYLPKGYEIDTTLHLEKGYVREILMPYTSNTVHCINVTGNKSEIITIDIDTKAIINRHSKLKNCTYFKGIDKSGRYLYYYDLKTFLLIEKLYRIDLVTGEVKKVKNPDKELDAYAFKGTSSLGTNFYTRDQLTLIRIPALVMSQIIFYRYIRH